MMMMMMEIWNTKMKLVCYESDDDDDDGDDGDDDISIIPKIVFNNDDRFNKNVFCKEL